MSRGWRYNSVIGVLHYMDKPWVPFQHWIIIIMITMMMIMMMMTMMIMIMIMCKNQALQAEFILGFLCHASYILLLLPSTPSYSSSFIDYHGVSLCLHAWHSAWLNIRTDSWTLEVDLFRGKCDLLYFQAPESNSPWCVLLGIESSHKL